MRWIVPYWVRCCSYGFEFMKVLRQFAGDTLGSLSLARRVDGLTDFVAQSFQRSVRSAYVSHPKLDPSYARRANLCPLHAPAVAGGNCAVLQLQQLYNALWDLRKCPKSQSDLQAKLSIRHAKLTHYRDVVLEAVMSMRLALVRGCTDGWMCFYDTTRGSASSQPTIGGNGKQISSGRSSTQVLRTRTRKLWLTCHLSSGCGTSSSRALGSWQGRRSALRESATPRG